MRSWNLKRYHIWSSTMYGFLSEVASTRCSCSFQRGRCLHKLTSVHGFKVYIRIFLLRNITCNITQNMEWVLTTFTNSSEVCWLMFIGYIYNPVVMHVSLYVCTYVYVIWVMSCFKLVAIEEWLDCCVGVWCCTYICKVRKFPVNDWKVVLSVIKCKIMEAILSNVKVWL